MHEFIYSNGSLKPASGSPEFISNSVLYGKGVFTTIAVHHGTAFLREKHWRRLAANASALSIDISDHREEDVWRALERLIEANRLDSGRARITFLDNSQSTIWGSGEGLPTSLLITTAWLRPPVTPMRVTVSRFPVNSASPLAGVKSCNYLEPLLAYEDAKAKGFDEAIRLNEHGEITSGSMANLFWTKADTLFTPSLKTGCLAGTTREYILENLSCEEVEAGIGELEGAEQIFLTSAGIGVAGVSEFNGRLLDVSDHPIKKLIPA